MSNVLFGLINSTAQPPAVITAVHSPTVHDRRASIQNTTEYILCTSPPNLPRSAWSVYRRGVLPFIGYKGGFLLSCQSTNRIGLREAQTTPYPWQVLGLGNRLVEPGRGSLTGLVGKADLLGPCGLDTSPGHGMGAARIRRREWTL